MTKLTPELAARIYWRHCGKRKHWWQYERGYWGYDLLRAFWVLKQSLEKVKTTRKALLTNL